MYCVRTIYGNRIGFVDGCSVMLYSIKKFIAKSPVMHNAVCRHCGMIALFVWHLCTKIGLFSLCGVMPYAVKHSHCTNPFNAECRMPCEIII